MNVKKGDLAEIIKSVDGINVGKIVEVSDFAGNHSQHGPIWLVRSRTLDLVTEYGGVGDNLHCADDWLKRIPMPGEKPKEKIVEKDHEEDLDLVS